ncbi:ATP-binding protein [Candidatus Aerophobetes bacterium]|uniref:Iron-sulfur cluster carrier protein n=1 Tax=Aerophobetes bacterium TaxID=2030807 RepID=A0A662CYZ6_UNCAE|nr:MAG: ATP-binding protein [Candidatus Aerophobetes bacterium]
MRQASISPQQDQQKRKIEERMEKIKHKLIIISGKGGVGKSTVAVNLAYGLLFQGKKVGILDVDIHGPSLAKMLGVEGRRLNASGENVIEPISITPSLKMVTIASLLESADTPVIWRGPLKMKLISQFLGDVNWGKLDYLVVDSPPGTGDEPLSVAQLIPGMDGAIIVTTPQEVALLDSRKSVGFAKALKIPVIGIIENMSGLICPHCGGKIELFKTGGGEKAAKDLGVPFLGRIPIEPDIVNSTDEGRPFIQVYAKTRTAEIMDEIVAKIMEEAEDEKVR